MKNLRHVHGALSLETSEARPIFEGDELRGLEAEKKNRAKDIIEDFMIAANGVTARYLSSRKLSSIRRVVRTPKRWERIVELAGEQGFALPHQPESKALEEFLTKERAADPLASPSAGVKGTRGVPDKRAGSRPPSVPRPLPRGHQTAWRRRICCGTSGRHCSGPLRSRCQGLYPFHGPESPVSRSHHAAIIEGRH